MVREYKDSGIEWIGDVPEGWKIKKVKYIVDTLSKGNGISKEEVFSDGDTPCVRYGEIYSKYNHSFKNCVSSTNIAIQKSPHYFNHGDILCAGTGELVEEIGKSIVYLGEDSCLAGGDIIVITHRQDPSFLFYSLNSHYAQTQKSRGKAKLKVVHISAFEIGSIYLLLPSLAEQRAIASYLDKKCAEIDSLVELQEQMIAQLTDYKQSVITEAVTKGLNPEAELVSSGIDWIGDYPKHWDIIKIGFIFDNLDYLREPISAELRERNNPQYDYYGASGVIDKIDHYNVDDKVLLIGEDGANLVLRNLPLVYKAEGKFWVNNHAHILKPKKDDYDYLAHALEAANYRNYITGSAQPKLSQENLQAVKLPIPPLEEQQSIASYLDTKCHEIDTLISIKQQKIETLKEYKKSIIFEAVTGKTD